MNQKRQPAGTQSGGEFAKNEHDEAHSSLVMSDEDYNKTGSFLYPPFPRSADQLISFYENSTPTESQLTKFAEGYVGARMNWAKPRIEEADERFKNIHGAGTPEASQAHWDYVAELESIHPANMNPLFSRDIAKAVQMHRFAPALDDAEYDRVVSHKITMANGQKETVGYLANRYMSGSYDFELN